MTHLRQSTDLSEYEKSLIRFDYSRICRGDHENAVAMVAEQHGVHEATVRLLVLPPTQRELKV